MLFAIGVLGAVIGSFVNVVSVREAKGEDFVHGRSYCPHCQHSLHTLDLLPILSYLFLRGKCRYCKQSISIRYFLVEIFHSILSSGLFKTTHGNSWVLFMHDLYANSTDGCGFV